MVLVMKWRFLEKNWHFLLLHEYNEIICLYLLFSTHNFDLQITWYVFSLNNSPALNCNFLPPLAIQLLGLHENRMVRHFWLHRRFECQFEKHNKVVYAFMLINQLNFFNKYSYQYKAIRGSSVMQPETIDMVSDATVSLIFWKFRWTWSKWEILAHDWLIWWSIIYQYKSDFCVRQHHN